MSELTEFLARQITRARIAIIIDATASREPTWDMAMKLQGELFEQVAKLSGLEVQLIYYRGLSECSRSPWMSDGPSMGRLMSKVMCRGGPTQIQRALGYVTAGNAEAEGLRRSLHRRCDGGGARRPIRRGGGARRAIVYVSGGR
jgi:hypothetical protein